MNELQNEMKSILEDAKKAGGISAEQQIRLDEIKSKLDSAEVITRSAAAASALKIEMPKDCSAILRSITKGSNLVGDKILIDDIVRQFEKESPIFAAHNNIKRVSNGNAFSFTKVVPGGSAAVKSEGSAGSADNSSAITSVDVTFSMYSAGIVTVSAEMEDDAKYDVAQEVIGMGMSKATTAFDVAAIAALEQSQSTPGTYTETAATSWAVSDILGVWLGLPSRHRTQNVKYIANGVTFKDLINLMDAEDSRKLEICGFRESNFVIDSNMANDELLVCDPTQALAVAMKEPVRVVKLDVSAGITYEVQPRLAVALRDATAVANRIKKAS